MKKIGRPRVLTDEQRRINKRRNWMRQYKKNRQEYIARHRTWWLKRAYGMTPEQFADLLVAQGGRCAMPDCRTADPGRTTWHVDHDHETKQVRGLLCSICNLTLGRYEKEKARFAAFEAYLAEPPSAVAAATRH